VDKESEVRTLQDAVFDSEQGAGTVQLKDPRNPEGQVVQVY